MYGVKLTGGFFKRGTAARSATSQYNYGFIIAVFTDAAQDGLAISAGFAAGQKVGLALALGLSVEMLFLAMSVLSETIKDLRIVVLFSLTIFATAMLGYRLLAVAAGGIIFAILAFSTAALIYLMADELLIEAHKQEEKPYAMLVLFAGSIGSWANSLT